MRTPMQESYSGKTSSIKVLSLATAFFLSLATSSQAMLRRWSVFAKPRRMPRLVGGEVHFGRKMVVAGIVTTLGVGCDDECILRIGLGESWLIKGQE